MPVTMVIYGYICTLPLSDKIRFTLCRPKMHPVLQSVPGGGGPLKTIKPCARVFRTSARVTSRFL